MFNPDPITKPVNTKLPKAIITMIEKNNLVMAIKTLAADENISMDEAKVRIDAYETKLKIEQQQKLSTIANKQGIPNQAISFDREQDIEEDSGPLVKNRVKSTKSEQGFKSLQAGVDSQLNDLGYKKPLLPYWLKRLLVIAIIMLGVFWILWRVFG
ncbi:hypothetical protein NJD71_02060 [Psychrobacter sp. PP-21]|uniref:hypothetical protein n=1 Tax=Psychrobacter sp. PP-21 TaxID=2957503 RepID=UPI0029B13E17|nr:hypothetical protein [Psychrobacter sp. PP-21]MDX2372907.1 hypothetical protein [Psychrobacter sp. PP-21]